MTIGAVDKIKPLGNFPVVDAVDVAESADRQFSSAAERAKLAAIGDGAKSLQAPTTILPQSGDLGELVFAILDAAGFLGAGLAKDGTLAGGKLRALVSMLTPLLQIPSGGAVRMGSQAAMSFAGDGAIKGSTGGTVDLKKTNYDFSICDAAGNVLVGIMDGKLYGPNQVTTPGFKRVSTAYSNGAKVDYGLHDYDFAVCDANGNVAFGWKGGKL